jgi:hypothetical protein
MLEGSRDIEVHLHSLTLPVFLSIRSPSSLISKSVWQQQQHMMVGLLLLLLSWQANRFQQQAIIHKLSSS